jgi:hypothetical protein
LLSLVVEVTLVYAEIESNDYYLDNDAIHQRDTCFESGFIFFVH